MTIATYAGTLENETMISLFDVNGHTRSGFFYPIFAENDDFLSQASTLVRKQIVDNMGIDHIKMISDQVRMQNLLRKIENFEEAKEVEGHTMDDDCSSENVSSDHSSEASSDPLFKLDALVRRIS